VGVERINNTKGIKARLRIRMQTAGGLKEKSVTVKYRTDLFVLLNDRPRYAQGFAVAEINAELGNKFIRGSVPPEHIGATVEAVSHSLDTCLRMGEGRVREGSYAAYHVVSMGEHLCT
jgi:hypothetical protein